LSEALRREWALTTGAGFLALALLPLVRAASFTSAVAVWAFCAWLVERNLADNRRVGEAEVLPGLGAATRITELRAFLSALTAGFLLVPSLAAPLYTASVLLDAVDGKVARLSKRETILGARLDLEVDAVGVLVASFGGILSAKLPLAYVAVGLARYLFVLGIAVRRKFRMPVRELDRSALRRALAGAQMGFLALTLWPRVPGEISLSASYPFGAATLLMFLRDFLFVCRRPR
jgi:CDP-diacylglycerol--glycerol-3-phosphate 3-phosphatidyltransferase